MSDLIEPIVLMDIAPELLISQLEEKQVVIYVQPSECYSFYADPQVVLLDRDSSHRSRLVTVCNISLFPEMTKKEDNLPRPCLIFEGLPDGCTHFDLVEPPRSRYTAWVKQRIPRNAADVYELTL